MEVKPVIVGLYGIPGSGKSYLLNQLKQNLEEDQFAFFEGSDLIASIVPGGLEKFHSLGEQQKVDWRQLAIDTVRKECISKGHVTVVAGHYMFWSEDEEFGSSVWTQNDRDTFTHILYLDVPAETVVQRRQSDSVRHRPSLSATHLSRWQLEEKAQLRYKCRQHHIWFSLLPCQTMMLDKATALLQDFKSHTEENNWSSAKTCLDEALATSDGQLKKMIVLDADKTLAAEDTGQLFWERISTSRLFGDGAYTLKILFSGPLGYTYTAFRQATLLYEETADDGEFDALCQQVAIMVIMHAEFVSLLQLVVEQQHVGAMVVTCGLRRVWEKVLEREGLLEKVKVIGGGRLADRFIVSPAVKSAMVRHLQDARRLCVWAFGDSPLDLDMLSHADRAIVVVGEEERRSKTMDTALANAIESGGLRAHQTVLPSSASPRLDTCKLPMISLTDPAFVESLLGGQHSHGGLQVHCATERTAAKLLATPMRDAGVAGPDLRNAHRQVGWYLAIEFLTDVVGLEPAPVQHVLSHETRGYRLLHERRTTIVALMRGGEPMASGVNEAFPLAMFVHAKNPDDIKLQHLSGQLTIILVDSVINTGTTIVECVQHIRQLHATIRIVILAGVVQAACISDDVLNQKLAHPAQVHLIALRTSDTKFTGSGHTDTGNRLFNTTHLL